MKKLIFTLTVFTFLVFNFQNASAQKFQAGASGGMIIPAGDWGDEANNGMGGAIFGKYFVKDNIAVGVSLQSYSMSLKSSEKSGGSNKSKPKMTINPAVAFVEYHFQLSGMSAYVGLDLGIYKFSAKSSMGNFSDSKNGLAPTFGLIFDLKNNFSAFGNAKYHYILTEGDATKAYGLNVGIIYTIK